MRPGQQNKRMRGRGRRGPSPLSRTYESNGPDVKIRGTASHIAEKYMQLARDAQASGDPVGAENYFQHAEHYFRIIAAAQAQNPQQGQGDQQRVRLNGADDFDDDADDTTPQPARGDGPQPDYRPQPALDQPQPIVSEGASDEDGEIERAEAAEAPQHDASQGNGSQQPRRRRRRPNQDGQAQSQPVIAANGAHGAEQAASAASGEGSSSEGSSGTLAPAGD